MPKRIVLTGGGTAGHVTPHLALIPALLADGWELHYIGTENGIERQMMEGRELSYHAIASGKLRRYFDWKNFSDPFRVLRGAFQASRIIKELDPDICFSKGGFVSVPVVLAAWRRGVPVLAHESDLTPGLANRISARFAKKVATTFPECAQALGKKGLYSGTPLRPELFLGSREKGLALAGFEGKKPVLLATGGSQGAQRINEALREALPTLLPRMDILHLCGKGKLDAGLQGREGYWQAEFLGDELPDALACADFVLSRAGANSLCELQALKKPMLLIPYPKTASRGDQILNAQSYARRGLAHVLLQEDLSPESLSEAISKLMRAAPELRKALEAAPPADGSALILELIEQLRRRDKPAA